MTPGPLLLTVAETATMLRCSHSRVFGLLADGTLVRGARFGKKTVVLAESVFQALEKQYDPPAPPKKRIRPSRGSHAEGLDAVLNKLKRGEL